MSTLEATRVQERRFELARYDVGVARQLERELGVSHTLAQVLARKGFTDSEAARDWLGGGPLHSYSEFAGIEGVVATVRRAIEAGERIVVHGDYDCDGVCATAVLVRALESLGANVGWYLPSREADGYGLAAHTVERLAARGTKLLITVDCGITAVEETALARSLGLQVVITDHHTPRADGQLPDTGIVHPGVCGYPFGGLCGTAVAYRLAQAIGAPNLERQVELVALATVADLMVLQDENRTLVQAGLAAMAGSENPGLRALMKVSRTDPSDLNTTALGFRLAPRINAAGRMGRADGALELLLTADPERAREIAEELDQINGNRRAVEQRISSEAIAQAKAQGDQPIYVLAGAGWHAGVVGIVASRVVEECHRPAIVIALDAEDEHEPASGSARSIPGFDLLAALDSAADCMVRYGGHRAAAGVTVEPARIAELRERLVEYADPLMTPELLAGTEHVDAVVSVAACSLELAEELTLLEPCGVGNPAPRLLIPGAKVSDVRPMSEGKHARFTVTLGGSSANAVAFGCGGHPAGEDGAATDLSFSLERNVWNGVVEPRLLLRHGAVPAPEPVEVIGAQDPVDYVNTVVRRWQLTLAQELAPGTSIDRPGAGSARDGDAGAGGEGNARTVIDRRGDGALVVVRDVVAAAGGEHTLVVCADVQRRGVGLGSLVGGFTLTSHQTLGDRPSLIDDFSQVVVLDPPDSQAAAARLRAGSGFMHLCWGEPELRFALQTHELEYGLRGSLVAVYRSLRDRGEVSGEEFGRLLRGDEAWPRSASLATRLLRVMTELSLASFEPISLTLRLADTARTELERSAAFRAYSEIYEDGKRFLSKTTTTAYS